MLKKFKSGVSCQPWDVRISEVLDLEAGKRTAALLQWESADWGLELHLGTLHVNQNE